MKPRLLFLKTHESFSEELGRGLADDYDVVTLTTDFRSLPRVLGQKISAELVVAGGAAAAFPGVLASRWLGVPAVAVVPELPREGSRLSKGSFKRLDGVLVEDANVTEHLCTQGVPRTRIARVKLGVNLPDEKSLPSRFQAREALTTRLGEPLERRPILLGLHGEVSPAFVLGSLPKLVRDFPDLLYLVIGKYGPEILEIAQVAGVGKAIRLIEKGEDESLFMRAANALVFPASSRDLLRANALGLPAIVDNRHSAASLIEEGVNGVVVDALSSEECFGKTVFLLNRFRERDWSFDCRQTIASKHAWSERLPRLVQSLEAFRQSRTLPVGSSEVGVPAGV